MSLPHSKIFLTKSGTPGSNQNTELWNKLTFHSLAGKENSAETTSVHNHNKNSFSRGRHSLLTRSLLFCSPCHLAEWHQGLDLVPTSSAESGWEPGGTAEGFSASWQRVPAQSYLQTPPSKHAGRWSPGFTQPDSALSSACAEGVTQQTATSRWESGESEKHDRMGRLSSSRKAFQDSTQRSLWQVGSLSSRRRTNKHYFGFGFFFFFFFSSSLLLARFSPSLSLSGMLSNLPWPVSSSVGWNHLHSWVKRADVTTYGHQAGVPKERECSLTW